MKKLKFLLCILLTIGTVLFVCGKSDVVLANAHTLHTVTSFGFVDHYARVNVDFTGYRNTSELRIDIRIEKQNFLFFNETVVSESHTAWGESYQNEFFYPIFEDGIYHCTVTYTVTNGNGKDLITFSDTGTYQLSDHTEHTHVWNRTVVEPTCLENGFDLKFCYCGEAESSILEKRPHTPGSNYIKTEITEGSYYLSYPCVHCGAIAKRTFEDSETASYNTVVPTGNTTSSSNITYDPYTGWSSTDSQCDCPFCKLDKAMPDTQPTLPKTPTIPTVDPWKKQQEAYANRNNTLNPYHINNSYLFK